jgi:RNA polymerase sigma-70 factor, ECF subfamily
MAVTDWARSGDSPLVAEPGVSAIMPLAAAPPTFDQTYQEHFEFVWRSLRALGVDDSALEDAVQDVFLIVHRKLDGFEARSAMPTWLYGIVKHVAYNHRRRRGRKDRPLAPLPTVLPAEGPEPEQQVADREAWRFVRAFLERLDASQREVFVLCELEQLPAPEVAELVGAKVNTVYSRLRAARDSFRKALSEHKEAQP